MSSNLVAEVSKEQQWCADLRGLLKSKSKRFSSSGESDLKKSDGNTREALKKLNGVDSALAEKYKSKYDSIANKAKGLGETELDAAKLVSVELDLLEAQINRDIAAKALAGSPDNKKAKREDVKAKNALDSVNKKLDGAYQKLMAAADDFGFKLGREKFYDKSSKYKELIDLRDKWKKAKKQADDSPDVSAFDYARALTELPKCSDLFSDSMKQIKEDQQEESQRLEFKGKYQSKVERLQLVKANLEGRLGLATDIKEIDDVIKSGAEKLPPLPNDHVTVERYNVAFNHIKSQIDKTSNFEAAALKKEKKLRSSLMDDTDTKSRYENAVNALENLVVKGEELISGAEYELQQKNISLALGLTADKEQKQDGLKKLDSLANGFKETRGTLRPIRANCNSLVGEVSGKLKDLTYAPDEESRVEIQLWISTLREAETDIGRRQFSDAESTLKSLKELVEDKWNSCKTKPSDYEEIWNNGDPKKWRDFLGPEKAPENTPQYKLLTEANKMASAKDYVKAIETLKNAFELAQTFDSQKSFRESTEFKEIVRLVEIQIEECRKAVASLENALKSNTDFTEKQKAGLLGSKNDLLKRRISNWQGSQNLATKPEDLTSETVDTHKDEQSKPQGFEQAFASLAAHINELSSEQGAKKLRGELFKSVYEQGSKEMVTHLRSVDNKLEELASYQRGDIYKNQLGRRNAIEAAAPDKTDGFEGSFEQLKQLISDIDVEINKLKVERSAVLEEFKREFESLKTGIKDLKDSVKDDSKRAQRKFFTPFFEELDSDADALAGIEKSTSISSIQLGINEIKKLLQTVAKWKLEVGKPVGNLQELVADALGKNDPEIDPDSFGLDLLFSEEGTEALMKPEVTPSFALVLASLESIKEELDNEDLKKVKPTTNHILNEDFQKIRGEVKGLSPEDGLQRLRGFQQTLTTAIDETYVAKQKRDRFETNLLPHAKGVFKEVTGVNPERKIKFIGKTDKAYFEELERNFNAAKGLIETENKEDEAIKKLEAFNDSLKELIKNPDLLQTKEREAQQRLLTAEQEEKQFKTMVSEFRKKTPLPQVKTALEVDGADKTLLEDVENLVKKAEDIFAKTANFKSAETILSLAHDRADYAIKFPLGSAATARGELGKVAARWKKAIRTYVESLDKVLDLINKEVETEVNTPPESESSEKESPEKPTQEESESEKESHENAIKQVQAAQKSVVESLTKLKRVFNPDQFDSCIATINTKKVDPRDARAAREQGLRNVRRYMDMIMKDPVMVRVMKMPRPFGIVELSAIYSALRDLDLNLQRSVK